MENHLTNPIILAYFTIWLMEFYLFGMQRASLKISRYNNVSWKGIGEQLLPTWYPLTWIVRITKYSLIIWILIFIDWKWAVGLLFIGFIISSIIPIPYRFLYKKIFRNKVEKIKCVDISSGNAFDEMLNNTGF